MIKLNLPKDIITFDYERIKKSSLIEKGKFYERPRPLLELIKTMPDGVKISVPVLTEGNISVIQGKAKSRKTFFLSLASYMVSSQNEVDKIVIMDTEQYNYHSQLTQKRILNLNEKINLQLYNIRPYSTDVRLEFIENYIINEKPKLMFIDNIRDCLVNINSWEETNNVLTTIIQLCDNFKTHVVCTLHENPAKENDKARGAIGTELQNKAETVFKIETEKETEFTKVEGLFTRNMNFDILEFKIDDKGNPVLVSSFDKEAAKKTDKVYTLF
jgi:hypothetical protein